MTATLALVAITWCLATATLVAASMTVQRAYETDRARGELEWIAYQAKLALDRLRPLLVPIIDAYLDVARQVWTALQPVVASVAGTFRQLAEIYAAGQPSPPRPASQAQAIYDAAGDLVATNSFVMDCPTCGPGSYRVEEGVRLGCLCDYEPPSLGIDCGGDR